MFSYLKLGVKTFTGLSAMKVSEVCKSLILWSRDFKRMGSRRGSLYDRDGNLPLQREFAVERAEAELRVIRSGS